MTNHPNRSKFRPYQGNASAPWEVRASYRQALVPGHPRTDYSTFERVLSQHSTRAEALDAAKEAVASSAHVALPADRVSSGILIRETDARHGWQPGHYFTVNVVFGLGLQVKTFEH